MVAINHIYINSTVISEFSIRTNKVVIRTYSTHAKIKNDILNVMQYRNEKTALRTCKLYYFVLLCNRLGIKQISNDVFLSSISHDKQDISDSKKILKDACYIDYTSHQNLQSEEKYKKGKKDKDYTSEYSTYIVLSSDTKPLNSSSSSSSNSRGNYKQSKLRFTFEYSIEDSSFLDLLRSKVPFINGGGVEVLDYRYHCSRNCQSTNEKSEVEYCSTDDITVLVTDCGPMRKVQSNENQKNDENSQLLLGNDMSSTTVLVTDCDITRKVTWNLKWTDIFKSFYNKLTFACENPLTNVSKTNAFKNTKCFLHPEDLRFYHPFHSVKRNIRKYVKLDGEPLVEKFDVHNCHYALLNALIKNEPSIPQEEKDRYWKLTVEDGRLYEEIADFSSSTRQQIKEKGCAKYLNYRNETLEQLRRLDEDDNAPKKKVSNDEYRYVIMVDKFFEAVFPNIRKYVFSIKSKDFHSLHRDLNMIETEILVYNIAYTLYTQYNIKALTLHDGIYVKESDALKMNELNISTEIMFKDILINFQI